MSETPGGSVPPLLAAGLAGRYRLIREIGAGGMAVVYLAEDLKHQRQVAVKVLRPEVTSSIGSERFLTEIRITARLDHPRILTLIDSGEAAGSVYYVLPYVRGESLRALLEREKSLPFARVVEIVAQVASALDYAHRQGIIHRDLKPDNILLFEGEAMLADFGIALALDDPTNTRLTKEGNSLGTPFYMSPEQASGERSLTPASDTYSLAAMTYEMLAGTPPFQGVSVQEVFAKLLTETAPELRATRGDVPAAASALLRRGMAKHPADRIASALEFSNALAAVAEPKTLLMPSGETPVARGRTAALLLGALLIGGGVVGLVMLRSHRVVGAAPPSTQLTNSGYATLPALSPDGSQVAYAEGGGCDDAKACPIRLMLRETASEAARVLVDSLLYVFPYQWSPDGLYLLFNGNGPALAGGSGQHVISRLGGTPTALSAGVALFTPTGDTIVTSPNSDKPVDGPVALRFLPPPWQTPSESTMVAPPGRGYVMTTLRLQRGGRWMAVGWIDWVRYTGQVTIHDRTGRVTDTVSAYSPNLLRWSPDQRSLLLPLPPDEGPGVPSARMRRIAIDPRTGRAGREDTVVIAPGLGANVSYDFSADGRTLVYSAERPGLSRVITHSAGPARGTSTDATILSTSDQPLARITPAGDRILLQRQLPGAATRYQWSMGTFTGGLDRFRPVTPPLSETYAPTALSDSALYLLHYQKGSGTSIIAYQLSSGEAHTIATRLPDIQGLTVGPGGELAVMATRGSELRLLERDGRERWHIAIADSLGTLNFAYFTADGRALVTMPIPNDISPGPDGNVPVSLIRIDARDGSLRRVGVIRLQNFQPTGLTADGMFHLRISTKQDPDLLQFRMPITGGPLIPEGRGFKGYCRASRDLRRSICVETESPSDLYLVRDLPGL